MPQDGFTAHGVHQGDLHAGELNVSRHQVNTFRVVQDTLTGLDWLIHHNTAHCVGLGKGQLVRLGVAQADGQTALRVPVDQQSTPPFWLAMAMICVFNDFTSFLNCSMASGNRKSRHFKN